jgi:guanylate kinase
LSSGAPNLFIVSAPSGAGKSTVLARVLAEMERLRFSVSHTTRPPRSGEREGVEYHFVSEQEFDRLEREGLFLESAHVHSHRYGTCRSEYQRAERDGLDLLLDLDVQGAAQLRRRHPEAVSVFLLPPSYAALERRLRGRAQDDEVSVRRRLEVALQELRAFRDYDYAIVNDDIGECVRSLTGVIRAARCRTERMRPTAERILETFENREEN